MKRRRNIAIVLAMMLAVTALTAGCTTVQPAAAAPESAASETGEFKFDRKIELVVGFGTGSGTDTG